MLGLLIVDHGSRQNQSNKQLEDMAERVRRLRPQDAVAAAHMEIAEPSIATTFSTLVKAGATRIYVLPYFLGSGRHISEDIPNLVAEAAKAHPNVVYSVASALGPHDLLAKLLLMRASLE